LDAVQDPDAPRVPDGLARQGVTIREVATRAGVSMSTVSRVLGGRTVRPRGGTAEAVATAVRDLDYRADLVARSMRTGSTAAIGVVVDNLLDPVFPGLVSAIADTVSQAGYAILLGTAPHGPEQAAREIEEMLGRRVDGIIIACSWPSDSLGAAKARLAVPVVLTNTDGPGGDLPQFGTDNIGGARLAMEHLLALGHRRVAYVGSPSGAPFDTLRLEGMRSAMRHAGVDPGRLEVIDGDGSTAAGMRAVGRLLETHATAVACYNDLTAIGAMRGLHVAGRSVPHDVSVIGFDDVAEASWMQPALTTVHQASREMGRLAAECLVRRLRDGDGPTVEPPIRLPMTLRVRESTAPPRGPS
jgi:DNA-binding LacI/PurR family transcriptional regulator